MLMILFFQALYDLPETSRRTMMKGMSGPWRRFKSELRKTYMNGKTYEEWLRVTPPKITAEDWIEFCNHENTTEAEQSRVDNKKKREQYDYSHTSGRKPHAMVRAELVCELLSTMHPQETHALLIFAFCLNLIHLYNFRWLPILI